MSKPSDCIMRVAIDGVVDMPLTSIAKAILGCFKLSNRIGVDIVFETLRDAWSPKKVTMDQLGESAEMCPICGATGRSDLTRTRHRSAWIGA